MLAYTYVERGKFELQEKQKPALQDDRDAIIRVTLASICTSDLHIKHGSVPRAVPGVTVGHEMVGVVEAVGLAVAAVKPGDRVAVNVETFCGECFFCKHGYVNNCTDPNGGGGGGGRAEGAPVGAGLPHRRGTGGVCPGAVCRSGVEQDSGQCQRPPGSFGGRRAGHGFLGGTHF